MIVAPHYPPSNLAGVHRSRLFAQHLPSFGWHPIILTVKEKYYEEALDPNLERLLPKGQQVVKVNAFPVTQPRLVGDIGLRAFYQLRRKALQLVQSEKVDFVYIPIPSFYASLIGPYLRKKTGVSYGIDYIDPWVHHFPGSEKTFSRHWWSTKLSGMLEPIAVKKAALITGVAEGYYRGVQERNPHLKATCVFGAMPYGGEAEDHQVAKRAGLQPYLFARKKGVLQLVYAGAMLPKAYQPLEAIFGAMAAEPHYFANVEIHFIGTGSRPNDVASHTIKSLAERFGLYQSVIYEYPKRIPYLDVLVHLAASDGIFVLGSTEPHYTPSKIYQGILSEKYILAVLHRQSTAVNILQQSGAGTVLPFDGEEGVPAITQQFRQTWTDWKEKARTFQPDQVNRQAFEPYSARSVTGRLVSLLNAAIKNDAKGG